MIPTRTLPFRPARRKLLAAGIASIASSLTGCGGGSEGLAGVGSGGTGSFSSGPILGFGSIIVNGVRFDETEARVLDETGLTTASSDLRLGMIVEVTASPIVLDLSGVRRASASAIGVRSEIVGPVEAIDKAGGAIIVLGQRVRVTASTVFDEALLGRMDSLGIGQVVEIFGLQGATGGCIATRIALATGVARYKLRGRVERPAPIAATFKIGAAELSYAGLSAAYGAPLNGDFVRVELKTDRIPSGHWQVIAFSSASFGPSVPEAAREVELEGVITAVTDAVRFEVAGVQVDASGAAGLAFTPAVGLRVEIEGVLSSGRLLAVSVELEDDEHDTGRGFEIEGRIDRVDPAQRLFTVRGVTVRHDAGTVFDGGSSGDLRPGVMVDLKGRLASDGVTILATEIEFDSDSGSDD